MKKYLLLIVLLAFVGLSGKAQEQKITPSVSSKKNSTGIKKPLSETKCKGLFNEPSVDLKWKPILKMVQPEKDNFYDEHLEALKKENDKIKTEFEMQNKKINSELSTQSVTPVIGVNYLGNLNNGCPPDNSIAISNGGYIVATANSTIEYDDMNGNNLYYKDLEGANGFFADATLTSICDANVIYDAGADRFIMVTQTCQGNSSTSEVIMCFSKTNNPLNGWWVYRFSGNPLNDASWFDFPSIGVSTNELYVSGNLIYDAGGFNQTCLFQMTKSVGYAGGTYNSTNSGVWYNVNDGNGNPSFTIVPAQGGQSSNYGPGVYMVSNDRLGGSTLTLYDLTDDWTGNPTINAYSVSTPTYAMGSNAYQLGSSDRLDIRDLRMQSAFYLNGIVHCVFHAKDPNSAYQVINYNRITVSNQTNQSSVFGLSGYDYTYPTVASYATSTTDKSVMIDFLRSGSSIYPEERVVNCDDNMNWSSSTQVQAGQGPVTVCYASNINANRWGDYTGISRKHNSPTPSVWLTAQYGTSSNDWLTWIAEVHDNSTTGTGNISEGKSNMKIFPNPIVDIFKIEFSLPENSELSITITDVQGKLVKYLFKGMAIKGENIFSFDKSNLTQGIYFLNIQTDKNTIKNDKIIIAN